MTDKITRMEQPIRDAAHSMLAQERPVGFMIIGVKNGTSIETHLYVDGVGAPELAISVMRSVGEALKGAPGLAPIQTQ